MLYPRMLAVAETAWTPAERKNADDFGAGAISESERMRTEGFTVFDLNTEVGNRPEAQTPVDHLAKGEKVRISFPLLEKLSAGGDSTLVDGLRSGWNYCDRLWRGFLSADSDEACRRAHRPWRGNTNTRNLLPHSCGYADLTCGFRNM